MSHSITAKLNNPAREHQNQSGVTFFVSLGEKNYDFKTKQNVWTNYDAALFAKDAQIDFYRSSLVEGAIVEVTGTGLILDAADAQYKPKLIIQDAKLGFINSPQGAQQQAAPQQGYQQQAPQQGGFTPQQQAPAQGGFQQPQSHNFNNGQVPQQQGAVNQTAPNGDFDDTIPF